MRRQVQGASLVALRYKGLHMIRGLFARLTADPQRSAALFGSLVAIARQPHWYVEGEVPDTLDGRFAVIATVVALASVRLDQGGEKAREASVALTERFIEAMDVEHREMGLGDPTLGKTVRKLVGRLAKRVERWREAVEGGDWAGATARSLYKDSAAGEGALGHSRAALSALWRTLEGASDADLIAGRIG